MKKYFSAIGLILFLLLIPSVLLAQKSPATGCKPGHAQLTTYITGCLNPCNFKDHTNCAVCCLMNGLLTVKDWVFTAAMIVSTLMVIVGALMLTTAGGDPSKVNSGRNYILYAIIGFTVALLSTALPALAQGLLGLVT